MANYVVPLALLGWLLLALSGLFDGNGPRVAHAVANDRPKSVIRASRMSS